LFGELPAPSQAQLQQAQSQAAAKRSQGAPRLLQPNRTQIELRASDLESLLAEDHRARLVWGYVVRQDLSALLDEIKARGSNAGRARIDPRILFALWLYAVLDGVGSGREVARLTREHDAYRWICGGVSVNYHALNDFRANNEALTDELLSDNVAALAATGAISLERVAQDGMRVRASAGAASFRRQASLQEHLAQARELVQTLKTEADTDPGLAARRAQAAKLRAARQREERIEQALKQLPEVAAAKRRNGSKAEDARASTTDADARVMKMGDGGFRPAYNVQFATTCDSQVIVGMAVVNAGSVLARPPRSGWSTVGSRRTSRSMRWRARPSCTPRCPRPSCPRSSPNLLLQARRAKRYRTSPARRRSASSTPSRATAPRWPNGARA
jgi:transposase